MASSKKRPRKRRRSRAERYPTGSPSRYIARISEETGREISGTIDPDELLVHAHRDHHPIEVAAQFIASRLIHFTGQERTVRRGLRALDSLGVGAAEAIGRLIGSDAIAKRAKRLIGVAHRDSRFRFREPSQLSEREVSRRIKRLQRAAAAALQARGPGSGLHVLLTGATGFVGKEILSQAATNPAIARITAIVRPEKIRDRKTREVIRVLEPRERGVLLLRRLGIGGAAAKKFRFVPGDIEQPDLGLTEKRLAKLSGRVTHVVHCAASVSFDDTYENSYRANVLGCKNALEFSLALQETPGSPFVTHVAIETSYIHGRGKSALGRESGLDFPRHFYNNFYELTKAMASIETDRFMIESGLRVAQLLPSIVVGEARTGNNRGDAKVVNAPINAFGRTKELTERAASEGLSNFARATGIAAVANSFPGDRSAELNLVPVDRVAEGILAALTRPEAIGVRIHLATDNRIRTEEVVRIVREELGVRVRLADPTLHRNITLPVATEILVRLGEPRLANALEKLGTIFAGYNEWGQTIHEIGNDVRILGLDIHRPNTRYVFRMLCRHNRHVQQYGRIKDPDEISRRERVWTDAIDDIEQKTGRSIGSLRSKEFRREIEARLELAEMRPV